MKIGIVGSRRREDKDNVIKLVDSLNVDDVVISGGCKGVDSWAEIRAKQRKMKTNIFKPDFAGVRSRKDMIDAYYQRNELIAENSDVIYAFVSSDRKGGTENTIKWAKKFNKKVVIK